MFFASPSRSPRKDGEEGVHAALDGAARRGYRGRVAAQPSLAAVQEDAAGHAHQPVLGQRQALKKKAQDCSWYRQNFSSCTVTPEKSLCVTSETSPVSARRGR